MGYAFEARPLTPKTWSDLESMFDLPGGSMVRGCWCMYYRKSGKVPVSAIAAPDNKRDLCGLVDAGVVPASSATLTGLQPDGSASDHARTTQSCSGLRS